MHDRLGSFEAGPESIDPSGTCRTDRGSLEPGGVEGQYDLQRYSLVEERLGDQDVRPRRQRTVREPDPVLCEKCADLVVHVRLEVGRKARGHTRGVDSMTAVVQDDRRTNDVQQSHVGRCGLTDKAELTPCHSKCREVVAGNGGGSNQGPSRGFHVTEDQRGLCFGRIGPVVMGCTCRCRVHQATSLFGEESRFLEIAGQEVQCRRVDARVKAAIAVGDGFVEIGSVS